MTKNHNAETGSQSSCFLDEVIRKILDSWSRDSFLDRGAAEREFLALAEWLRRGGEGEPGPGILSDRLLTRRLAELLLHGILSHWGETGKRGDPQTYLEALSNLQRRSQAVLPEHGDAFAARLADPDGFELVVELGHDLRSPLTSITFLAETLRGGHSGPLTEHQRTQLGLIYSASLGLTAIVHDVVDLARSGGDPREGEREAFSLHALLESVREVVQPLADSKRVELRTHIETHDRVWGHPLAINRVLLNLAINGLKFTDHGWVRLSVSSTGKNHIEFSVRDTGRGISPENRARLYEPFRRSGGREGSYFSTSGLGLTIVRRLLLSLGSNLDLETRPDWGTRFFFVLEAPPVTSL